MRQKVSQGVTEQPRPAAGPQREETVRQPRETEDFPGEEEHEDVISKVVRAVSRVVGFRPVRLDFRRKKCCICRGS